MKDAEYDDFRLARALMEEEKQAALEERERQAGNNAKLPLIASRASANMGINGDVNHYDTLDEATMKDIRNNIDSVSNASSQYENLSEASTPKHPVFGRQRSLSLTPNATGKSLKMSLSPQKGLMRNRAQSVPEQGTKSLKEYTEEAIKKFLKPLTTMAARKKFAYFDLIV